MYTRGMNDNDVHNKAREYRQNGYESNLSHSISARTDTFEGLMCGFLTFAKGHWTVNIASCLL